MSDTHPFDTLMAPHLDEWTLINDNEDGNNETVLTLSLGANFYFENGYTAEKREALATCVDKLQEIYGEQLRWWLGMAGGRAKKYKKFDAHAEIMAVSERSEIGKICGSKTTSESDEYRLSYGTNAVWDPLNGLSNLEVRLPAQAQNLSLLKYIFNNCCQLLKPTQAFAGIIGATAWGGDRWQPQEYTLGTEYYGVLVGVNESLWLRLKGGTFSPTWLLALNPEYYAKIGGDQGLAALGEKALSATHYDGGVILQAGEYPDPLPVADGLPEFWKKYNAWLKPIRNTTTGCFHTAPDDFMQQFDKVSTRMWYERMDEGAIWPPNAKAYEAMMQVFEVAEKERSLQETKVYVAPLTVYPGQPCPKSGSWTTHAMITNKNITVNAGETMPGPKYDKAGNGVIWYMKQTD